jgi:hypothetical protein
MQRISLNTAIMTFAFTGVLAPHRHPDETRGAPSQPSGHLTDWELSAQRENQQSVIFEQPIRAAAAKV